MAGLALGSKTPEGKAAAIEGRRCWLAALKAKGLKAPSGRKPGAAWVASAAVVPIVVIYDFEAGFGRQKPEDLAAIQGALERSGVEFIERGVRERTQ